MTYQILMIDDDSEMIALGRLILSREGFKFLSAGGGAEGLKILKREGQNIDLVLLDIMMVGMDGWHVLQAIKESEEYSHIPVIMLTARHFLENELETVSYADKFDSYVVKPFVVRELLGKIKELLEQEDDD